MGRCRNCGQKFTPKYNFLEKFCQSEACKEAEHDYKSNLFAQQTAKKNAKVQKPKSIPKPKVKSLTDWKDELQREINLIVRELDKNHNCICRPHIKSIRYEAGHFIGRQANPTLRYNLLNIFLQSHESNQHEGGDPELFRIGIINLFGEKVLHEIESLQATPPIRLTITDIQEKISISRGIVVWIRLQNKRFSINERLSLRRKFNAYLGIYK